MRGGGWPTTAGTFGVAAASHRGVPVYVVASRDQALATQFFTDTGPIAPADLPPVSERYTTDVALLLTVLSR
jgi:hypothetical protein